MKKILFGMMALASAGALAATVSNVSISGMGDGPVVVTYDLDAAAIVTFDVTTNGVSIGQGAAQVGGDANRRTLAGTGKRVVWMPHRDWEGHRLANVQVQLKAWDVDNPPLYLAVELHGGDVEYYASADLVPGGVTNRRYKTSHLLMRRIPAKDTIATLGSTAANANTAAREVMHRVKMSSDYYMGVYALTQGQFESVSAPANHSSNTKSLPNHEVYPLEKYSPQNMRGLPVCSNAVPTASSFLGAARSRTGLAFDLPNDTQWEFACRAGTQGNVNVAGATLDQVAWHAGNWQNDPALSANSAHEVGLLLPNAYGLYDMLGNTMEVTTDFMVWSENEYRAIWGTQVGTDTDGQPIYGDQLNKAGNVSDGTITCTCDGWNATPKSITFSPARKAAGRKFTTGNDALVGFRFICPVANGGRLQ